MSLYQYGSDFFSYQQIGSLASARSVVPIVLRHLKPASVLDVGCGAGAWIAGYLESGMTDVVGADAGYVLPEQLLFDASRFHAIDVTRPFRLERTFDVVQCIEVAEHLDPAASETLIDNLVAHAPIVVFSAAPPGQGGENHINERPYEFWRRLFQSRGYVLFDFLRPQIRLLPEVEKWYRYNLLVFLREDAIDRLDAQVAATRVDALVPVRDVAPLGWRVRRRLLSLLSVRVVTQMAAVKHWLVLHRNVPRRQAL